jgi:hypothetical protein
VFLVLLPFVLGLFLLIGLCGVCSAVLKALTALLYGAFLFCRFALPAAVVATNHLPVVGYFLLGTLALIAFNVTSWIIYWAMATHGARKFRSEFYERIVKRALLIWHQRRPCDRTTSWLRRATVALCLWLWVWWWDSFGF